MSIEFLGNKRQLIDFIYLNIQTETKYSTYEILDLFSGTGIVSAKFKEIGHQVIANDFLYFCTIFAKAYLYNNEEPLFSGIINDIPAHSAGLIDSPYDRVVNYLNSLPGNDGFIHKNYSPASSVHSDVSRMYFTEENARKIDAIRRQIDQWKPYLTEGEEALLISDLLRETNNVSNIAGTYGCYMKHWKKRALEKLTMRRSSIIENRSSFKHMVFNEDANQLIRKVSAPIIYLDPPYTKRQYSAYYHILETIAVGDEPILIGKTGLRPWENKSSDYCFRRKAPNALNDLITNADCKYLFLSYNNDGQIKHDDIINILTQRGAVKWFEMEYRRYKSNKVSTKTEPLKERLYFLKIN